MKQNPSFRQKNVTPDSDPGPESRKINTLGPGLRRGDKSFQHIPTLATTSATARLNR